MSDRDDFENLLNLNLNLLARSVVEGFITGMHKSPFHGFSVEFAEHRVYNPGESVKSIDWKLFARTDRLFNKRFEEETNLRCQLVVDASSSMYYPEKPRNKIGFVRAAVASLIYLMKRQKDAFGLTVFSEQLLFNSRCRSTLQHQRVLFSELDKLKDIPSRRGTALAASLHLLAESLHKRSLLVIFSDLFESIDEPELLINALQHLRHNKHEVIVFHVIDKRKEILFEFENRPYLFVDKETGREFKVNPMESRPAYVERIEKFRQEMEGRCGQNQIDYVEADSGEGFYPILKSFLIRRNKMV